jgi:D-glycero-D-manno-heptose 1,7-bisphosphate phosphatase
MNRAVFLDRDGTIIVDRGYLGTSEGVELLPGAGQALLSLRQAELLLVLVTNQSGVARGYFDLATVAAQHAVLAERLAPFGVTFAGIEVCPHHPEQNCDCRKPRPALLRRAADRLDLDLRHSYMVGDKPSDVAAGKAAGCTTVLVGSGGADADYAAVDITAAAAWICQHASAHGR